MIQHKLMKAAVAVVISIAFEVILLSLCIDKDANKDMRYRMTPMTVAIAIETSKRIKEIESNAAGNLIRQNGTRGSNV